MYKIFMIFFVIQFIKGVIYFLYLKKKSFDNGVKRVVLKCDSNKQCILNANLVA